jgi:hypothetical protein
MSHGRRAPSREIASVGGKVDPARSIPRSHAERDDGGCRERISFNFHWIEYY